MSFQVDRHQVFFAPMCENVYFCDYVRMDFYD